MKAGKQIPQITKKARTLPKEAEPHKWKPGQSGNPGGRPKGRSISDAMKALLKEVDPKTKKEMAEAIAASIIKGAHKNPSFTNILLDRTEGKVLQQVELNVLDGLAEKIAAGRKRAASKEK